MEFFKGFVPAGNDSSKAAAGEAPEEEKPKKAKKEPKVPDVVRNLTLSDVAGLAEMDDAFLLASFASQYLPYLPAPGVKLVCILGCDRQPGWLHSWLALMG